MSDIVSVWSSTKKTGKTVFTYMLASWLMNFLNKDLKVLIACVNFSYGNLMSMFSTEKGELNFEDLTNYKVDPHNKFNLLNALARKDNFYFLGSKKTSLTYASRHLKAYEELFEEFKNTFDLIIVDTVSGSENTLTNMIISESSFVLNVLNQDKEILDKYPFITGKELAFIVNKYKGIYPGLKELSTDYGIDSIFALPECSKLQDMKNRGNIEFYLQHETEYNSAIKAVAQHLVSTLGLGTTEECMNKRGNTTLLAKIFKQAMGGAM
jgi:MinD-like ATPase involved in chromosome partitioning or flagellar assembly